MYGAKHILFVVFLIVSGIVVLVFMTRGAEVSVACPQQPSTTSGEAQNFVRCKKAKQYMDVVQFQRYMDVSGPVYFPPAHYWWVTEQEKHVLRFFENVRCSDGSSVVDVGMNDGTYSVLAAARGCRVISFELQTRCISLACLAFQLNGVSSRVSINQKPVSDSDGKEYCLDIDRDCILPSGKFGLHLSTSKSKNVSCLVSTTLDSALQSETRIEFLKLDIEGHEPQALFGAQSLFKRNVIKRAVVECVKWPEMKSFPEVILNVAKLYDWGYTIECLDQPRLYPKKEDWLKLKQSTSIDCIDLGITLRTKHKK